MSETEKDNSDSEKIKCLNVVKEHSDEMTAAEMKAALTAIAKEVQRFRSGYTSDELPEDLDAYKSKLKIKRKQIKTLKENLTTACTIARTVLSAKETEFSSLNNHLSLARNESVNLLKKKSESCEVIKRLTTENHQLSEKIESLRTFIELGYKEVQKMRNSPLNDLPLLMQLKEILVCCGQYYADYCNEHEKCIQLEQKNRFLSNKLQILENNLETSTEELKNVRRVQNGKMIEKKYNKSEAGNIGYIRSEYKFGVDAVSLSSVTLNSIESDKWKGIKHGIVSKEESLDLSSHMSLVKNLLSDQDTMLKELKKLSEELGIAN